MWIIGSLSLTHPVNMLNEFQILHSLIIVSQGMNFPKIWKRENSNSLPGVVIVSKFHETERFLLTLVQGTV